MAMRACESTTERFPHLSFSSWTMKSRSFAVTDEGPRRLGGSLRVDVDAVADTLAVVEPVVAIVLGARLGMKFELS